MSPFHPLRIASVRPETRDAVVVTFDIPAEDREAFRFVQGQHLTLRAILNGDEVRRSYSICSAPSDGVLRIAIKRVQDGLFSTWAHQELRPGHVIDVMEPAGSFYEAPQPSLARHHVAFAAGSGITPIVSILKSILSQEPASRATLVYGNRSSASVIFKEELEDLKDQFLARLNLIFILSREQQDIELFNGRIDRAKCDALLQHWIDPRDIGVAYLCGPQSMMDAVSASLQAHGVPKSRIKWEHFGVIGERRVRSPAVPGSGEPDCKLTVIRDGHRREFTIARQRHTLLDAALEQGIDLPYSCKAGVCSTCRCKMKQGEVEMDVHYALEDYEIARGFILPCQSYPVTDEIVLDFDQET